MIENADADPTVVKNLTRYLRELPLVVPPRDLRGRILGSLPRHRGLLGRLEYALKREQFPRFPAQRSSIFLPSTPSEYGMALLSAGVFFLVMIAVVLVGVSQAVQGGQFELPGGLLRPTTAFAPAMLAAGLFMAAGWMQLQTRETINPPPRLGLTAAGLLFGLTAVMGLLSSERQALDVIAAWLGLSGIVVAVLLLVTMKSSTPHSLPSRSHPLPISRGYA